MNPFVKLPSFAIGCSLLAVLVGCIAIDEMDAPMRCDEKGSDTFRGVSGNLHSVFLRPQHITCVVNNGNRVEMYRIRDSECTGSTWIMGRLTFISSDSREDGLLLGVTTLDGKCIGYIFDEARWVAEVAFKSDKELSAAHHGEKGKSLWLTTDDKVQVVEAGVATRALVVPHQTLSLAGRVNKADELIYSTWTGEVGLLVGDSYSKSFVSNLQIRNVCDLGDETVACIPHIEGTSRTRKVEIWTLQGKLVSSVEVWSSVYVVSEGLYLQTDARVVSKVDAKGQVLSRYALRASNVVAVAPSLTGKDILVGFSDGRVDRVEPADQGKDQKECQNVFWPTAIGWTATSSAGNWLVVSGSGCHYFTKSSSQKDSVATTATTGVYLDDDTVVLTDSEGKLWIATAVNSKPSTRKIRLDWECEHLWLGPRLGASALIVVALLEDELRVYRLNTEESAPELEEFRNLRTAVRDVITDSVPSLSDGALAIPCEKEIVVVQSKDTSSVSIHVLPYMKYDRRMAVDSTAKMVYALTEGEVLAQSWSGDKHFESFKLPGGTAENIFCGSKGQLFANMDDGRLFVRKEGAWVEVSLKRQIMASACLQGRSIVQNLAGPPEFVTID
jgi:hypothetical protein